MKLTDIQCKHSELEKQLVDAALNIALSVVKGQKAIVLI